MPSYKEKVTVDRRLRPLRLAFLLRHDDREGLNRVLEANTCLWGGMYNPIIPCFERVPLWWANHRLERPSAREIVHGYLDAFEPDFVVYTDPGLKAKISITGSRVVSLDEVLKGEKESQVQYGLPVTSYYAHLYREEFRFRRTKPVSVILPRDPKSKNWSTFIAAVFGRFPVREPFCSYKKRYQELFEPDELEITAGNLVENTRRLFPLSIGSFGIEALPRVRQSDPTFFLMDPTRMRDVVDYWNLQALGWDIWPVPTQWSKDLASTYKKLAREIHRPIKSNPDIWHRSTILKSRSVDDEAFKSFYSSVNFSGPREGHGAVSMQHWFPRIWNDWAREPDHVVRPSVSWKEGKKDVHVEDGRISFSFISPDFVKDYGQGSVPRWANVINFHQYGDAGEYATCFPEGIGDCNVLFQGLSFQKPVVNSVGIAVPCSHPRERTYCNLPSTERVIEAWLKFQGVGMQVSSPLCQHD